LGVALDVIWYALRQHLPLADVYSALASGQCWSLICLCSASLRLHTIWHWGHACTSFLCAVFLCRRTSLLRLNQRLHTSHEPLSSFFLGFLCSTCCCCCCDAEPLLDDAALIYCTSNGPVEKSMAVSSPSQVAWRPASPLPPEPYPRPSDNSN